MNKPLLTAACAFFLTIGAATSHAQVAIRIGPPPPPRERIPPPPPEHRDWAWHNGYHRWDGQRYVWVPGVYEAPPRRGARWAPGRWVNRRGNYVWVDGRWR